MLTPETRALLSDSHLFRQVSFGTIEEMLNSCARHQLMPGDTLIESGIRNNTLYVVLSGELRVYAGGRDMPANAILETGDCAGEMSLIDGDRSSALVLAAAPSELLAIPHDRMWEMIDILPSIARNLLAIMSGRLRKNNLTLVTTQDRSLEFAEANNVDSLTGLHNLAWINNTFMRQIRRCRQDMAPISLVFADIDRLGQINERNGYLTGDNAVRRIARHLAESLRPQDMIGRYGGDEFVVLLPHTSLAEAEQVAARLCTAVASAGVFVPPSREPMTISSGVTWIKVEDDLAAALARATVAVETAKQNGRNRCATQR
jgi:diguanylate cyclase (GGDEF)-like protein